MMLLTLPNGWGRLLLPSGLRRARVLYRDLPGPGR
jgi:hypothetical protein